MRDYQDNTMAACATLSRFLSPRYIISMLAALIGGSVLLALAACGSGPYPTGSLKTPTSYNYAYAYLYSRVDYPLQIPVNASDTVILTLSPENNILEVTPGAGNGTATLGQPIPLPTDLRDYQDIGVAVDTVEGIGTGSSIGPIVWQLTDPVQKSLLDASAPKTAPRYNDTVTFHWKVRAVAEGQNLVRITIRLYYIALNGAESQGSIQMSQSPIPMLAVTPTALNTTLPTFRLPIAGLSGLAGFLAVLRFIWKAYETYNDVAEPAGEVVKVAGKVRARVNSSRSQDDVNSKRRQPPTKDQRLEVQRQPQGKLYLPNTPSARSQGPIMPPHPDGSRRSMRDDA